MEKILQFGDDCERRISITPTTGDLWCLEIHTRYPLAQHPRWQRNVQIIGTQCDLWAIGSTIHGALVPKHCQK